MKAIKTLKELKERKEVFVEWSIYEEHYEIHTKEGWCFELTKGEFCHYWSEEKVKDLLIFINKTGFTKCLKECTCK